MPESGDISESQKLFDLASRLMYGDIMQLGLGNSIQSRDNAWKRHVDEFSQPYSDRLMHIRDVLNIYYRFGEYVQMLGVSIISTIKPPFGQIQDPDTLNFLVSAILANSSYENVKDQIETNRIIGSVENAKNALEGKDLSKFTSNDVLTLLVQGDI